MKVFALNSAGSIFHGEFYQNRDSEYNRGFFLLFRNALSIFYVRSCVRVSPLFVSCTWKTCIEAIKSRHTHTYVRAAIASEINPFVAARHSIKIFNTVSETEK